MSFIHRQVLVSAPELIKIYSFVFYCVLYITCLWLQPNRHTTFQLSFYNTPKIKHTLSRHRPFSNWWEVKSTTCFLPILGILFLSFTSTHVHSFRLFIKHPSVFFFSFHKARYTLGTCNTIHVLCFKYCPNTCIVLNFVILVLNTCIVL